VNAEIQSYDWTDNDRGVPALHAHARNLIEAGNIARIVTQRASNYPGERIVLTSHSGGGAIAVWALERLPPGVQVDDVLLLAPALSPGYDLTAALRHVRGKMYVFWSSGDELILGFGCRLCGTMDGVYANAAGLVGFTMPPGADAEQYRKLDQIPYDPAWLRLGNFGDHVGPMSRRFAAAVLAPLVKGDAR
jgi:pimeloyl-ACP methyl ester carboxylesterase